MLGVEEGEFEGKKVFLRLDLDVPVENGEIADDTRLVYSFPTLEYLLEKGASIIAAGHLGRPHEEDPSLSLETLAKWYARELEGDAKEEQLGDFKGWRITDKFYLLENLRFYKEEEQNESDFSKKLAETSDIYVNEAFGSSHRKHASIVGVPALLPHFAGFHLLKEIKVLSSVASSPQRPLTVVIGGAKIETKLPLVEKMHHFAEYVLVGGEIAEQDETLLKLSHEKLEGRKAVLLVADLNGNSSDITQESVEGFLQVIEKSQTIIWNGPMGNIEEGSSDSTKTLADGITKADAYTIVGGGDTIAFLKKINLLDKFHFVSIGGGAMLEYLSGENLPGLEALEN